MVDNGTANSMLEYLTLVSLFGQQFTSQFVGQDVVAEFAGHRRGRSHRFAGGATLIRVGQRIVRSFFVNT